MKKSPNSLLWLLIAIVMAIGATTLLLSYMVTAPGNMMNELGGDGGKNYFTFLYHSIYGKGIWFEGMNYPYGEHIIYADGQPALSTFLHLFQPLGPHCALAIMNLALSLGCVLAIVFTYKILIRYGVKPFIAILFACLITLLSPQVMRMRSHFGLAYLCLVPMLFYFTIGYHETRKWRWVVYIFLLGCIMSFLHLYLGGIIFIWIALYFIGCFLFIKGDFKKRFRLAYPLLVACVSLFIFIKSFIALTDPVKDRPAFPLNTLETVTHVRDIFTSPYSPVWQCALDKLKFNRISQQGSEGFTYLGIAVICIVLISILIGIINRIKNKKNEVALVSENNFSPLWLFIAFGALFIAVGAPFIWHMEWLLNYMSIFKQFRSMGRFSWIFYLIITVYAVVALNSWCIKIATQRPVSGYAILTIVILAWAYEVSGYVAYTRAYIADGRIASDDFFLKNDIKWPEYLAEHHLKANDFQAILLLPLFVSGSEKLWVGGDPSWPLSLGMKASIELHLPIVDVMMSRTSWSETEKQVKMAAGPYADKPMLRDLKSNKPFLLLWYDGEEIDQDQAYLLKASDFIGDHYQFHMYACYPDRIVQNDKNSVDSIKKILPCLKQEDTCVGDTSPWFVSHFDTKQSAYRLFGTGSCQPTLQDDSIILDMPFRVSGDKVLYELSGWFLLDDKDYRSPYLTIKQYDSTGKEVGSNDAITGWSVDNHLMWFRASTYFNIMGTTTNIKINLNNKPMPTYIAFDELLLRPAKAIIISKDSDGKVMVNNHLVNLNK